MIYNRDYTVIVTKTETIDADKNQNNVNVIKWNKKWKQSLC